MELILGDGFFNRFYIFMDLEDHEVGIAKNKQNITMEKIFDLDTGYVWDPLDWTGLIDEQTQSSSSSSNQSFFSFFMKLFG